MQDLTPLFNITSSDRYPLIMAGPCSAESEYQVVETAKELSESGIRIYRAGVWKPRTRPGGFEGIGEPALEWIAKAKEQTGMMTLTEVATPEHLQLSLKSGIDGIWIGARTTANPFAMQALADALAALPAQTRDRLTVLVKNPLSPDIELWIGGLMRIYGAGVRRLGAIHRGFSAYGDHQYRNMPGWRIPIELRRRIPNLPIICDPSHMGGKREYVDKLSHLAFAMGFDGLFIESHISPDTALSDAAQQLTPAELTSMLKGLNQPTLNSDEDELENLRCQINSLDDELLDLLSRRMDVCRKIGRYKNANNIRIVQPQRYSELIGRRIEEGEKLGLSDSFVKEIFAAVHEESVKLQLHQTDSHTDSNLNHK